MKGLTVQERRVLIAILLALAIGAAVRYWRLQEGGEGMSNVEQGILNIEMKRGTGVSLLHHSSLFVQYSIFPRFWLSS